MRTKTFAVFIQTVLVFAFLALLLLPLSQAFIPDRNTGYEPGLVTVNVVENKKMVEPGSEAVFEAVLRNDNLVRVYIHVEVIPLNERWETEVSRNDFFMEGKTTTTILITLKAPEGAKKGTEVSALLMVNAVEDIEDSGSSNSRLLNAVVVSSDGGSAASVSMVVTGGLILLSIAGYFGSTEYGKYATMFVGAPLYSRIHKDKVLEHSTREEIYNYIKLNPGVNFTRIKVEFDLTNGTLLHHLKTLDREHYIKSCRTGLYRRFYPWGMKIRMESTLVGVQKTIFKFIEKNEGVCQTDIARELDTSRQTINHHVKALVGMNLVSLKRIGRKSGCFLANGIANS